MEKKHLLYVQKSKPLRMLGHQCIIRTVGYFPQKKIASNESRSDWVGERETVEEALAVLQDGVREPLQDTFPGRVQVGVWETDGEAESVAFGEMVAPGMNAIIFGMVLFEKEGERVMWQYGSLLRNKS